MVVNETKKGEIALSETAWKHVGKYFTAKRMVGEEGDPFYMLEKPRGTTRILNITKQVSRQVKMNGVHRFKWPSCISFCSISSDFLLALSAGNTRRPLIFGIALFFDVPSFSFRVSHSSQILLEATSTAEGSKALENVLRAYIANPVIQALATAAAAAAAAAEASGGASAGAGGKLKSGDGDDSADADAPSSSTALATRGAIPPSSASASSSAARAPADARDTRRASGLNKLTSSLANRIKQLTTAGVGAASSSANIAGGVSMAISLPSHPTLQVFF
jgi:hypothetical protein